MAGSPFAPTTTTPVTEHPESTAEGEEGDPTEAASESLTRVMALHALKYCERLFYLEEVEGIRVADENVFRGRALHLERETPDPSATETRRYTLSSDRLGLFGIVDAFRRREGGLVPYEHKRGRAARTMDGDPEAWPSDRVQVAAYAMLIEDDTGEAIDEGRVRYHADKITVRVPIDEATRAEVRAAVARAAELRASIERPQVTERTSLCATCSLSPVCLPEETRLATDETWQPTRLFPPHVEGQTVHVVSPRVRIRRSANTLVLEDGETGETRRHPIHEVNALVLHGHAQITTQALHFCVDSAVPVHWLTNGGRYVAGVGVGASSVQRRVRQYRALTSAEFCLTLCRRLVHSRIESQLRYLLRATRGDRRSSAVEGAVDAIRSHLRSVERASSLETLRGIEGSCARQYFGVLPELLLPGVPDELRPDGRTRRPPRDRFNAILSFAYALLYRSVTQAVLAVGLEPSLGFFHTPRSTGEPLTLDLMELFRVTICDIAVIGSLNRGQWDAECDFSVSESRVWLSSTGRRKIIEIYENRLIEEWRHPAIGYSLSYARTIELEARLLEKEWTDRPGLFARIRFR